MAVLAAALVLGVVGGTAVGYAVQADRAPTPLPPLAQQGLTHPAEPLPEGETIEPLPEEQDHAARTSGDLRKLLLPAPKGARGTVGFPDGWVRLDRYASYFSDDGLMLKSLAGHGFRRAASVSWLEGGDRVVIVTLTQFHPGATAGALELAEEMGYGGEPIPGAGTGGIWLFTPESRGDRDSRIHDAHAYAHRGDVMLEVTVLDTEPIELKAIRTLAERQLERL
ncbi:hypothetical protein ACRAR1_16520 [Streptomyces sanyensis]|uniref:hypothetical protein n=1 Tax=Streptomyces sanyensis TaxID=568869 RepID=UPI003D782CA8